MAATYINLGKIVEVTGAHSGVCILYADDEPANLEIYGVDVVGFDDDEYEFSVGSQLITPTADYIAFEPSLFTQKYNVAPTE